VVEHRSAWQHAVMLASLLYLMLRRLLTVIAFHDRTDQAAQLEILVLRHQLEILRRRVKRPVYRHRDRALLAAASRILPRDRWGAFLVRPETLLRWPAHSSRASGRGRIGGLGAPRSIRRSVG
jgi:putative transposase